MTNLWPIFSGTSKSAKLKVGTSNNKKKKTFKVAVNNDGKRARGNSQHNFRIIQEEDDKYK